MKVVHISTYDIGGAGLAAYRLHRGLLSHGIESRMLVAQKTMADETIIQAEPDKRLLYQPPKNTLLRKYQKLMRRRGKYLTFYERIQKKMDGLHNIHPQVYYTSPVSTYELSDNPLVQEADIIHLHWIQNFVNFKTFFCRINKPIVWTLHDLNPLFGGFHHILWKERFYDDYKFIEHEFYDIKKKAIIDSKNISVVAISKQMHDLISNHEFFRAKKVFDISNSVDANIFMPLPRKDVRKLLTIPINSTVFLFVNKDLNDESKGLIQLVRALETLKLKDSLLICLGDGIIPKSDLVRIRHFSSVSDSEWMSQIYSAADFVVLPSLQEGLSQTLLEALCCGTPIISTPVSGSDDVVTSFNGRICDGFTPDAIAKGITNAIAQKYNRSDLRLDAIARFGIDKIVEKYLSVYTTINVKNDNS